MGRVCKKYAKDPFNNEKDFFLMDSLASNGMVYKRPKRKKTIKPTLNPHQ